MRNSYFILFTFCLGFSLNAQIINFADANFKAKLLSASSSNTIASVQVPDIIGNVITFNSIDANNDGEIQVSEASIIKYLNVSSMGIQSLNGIEYFSNLHHLSCGENEISSLALNGLTNLRFLYCSYNNISNMDISDCSNLIIIQCLGNLLTTINTSTLTQLKELVVISNQITSLDLTNNSMLEMLLLDDNLIQNIDLSSLSNLWDFGCSSTPITSLDLSNQSQLAYFQCTDNSQLTSIDLSNAFNLFVVDIGFNQNLNSLNIKNGVNDDVQSFYFHNNPNLKYICADEGELINVQSKINEYEYTNCHVNSYCSFTPGGNFYTIEGGQLFDSDANGCDNNDLIFPNVNFSITNGINSGTLFSNTSGNYVIPVVDGTHTITPIFENPNYFISSPVSSSISFPASASPFVQNFCFAPNGNHNDLEVFILPLNEAISGNVCNYKIVYKNKGTTIQSGSLNLTFNDEILDLTNSIPALSSQTFNTLNWTFNDLKPFESREILIALTLNSSTDIPPVNVNDIIYFTITIDGQTDETPFDNIHLLSQSVAFVQSLVCLQGLRITPNQVGDYIHYMMRFQNTGVANVENIVVRDIIDTSKFDITSLVPVYGSHPFVTRITNTNKVEFIFENIQLPFDDANNDGYIVFKIKTSPTLVLGNTIGNSASIYFDYNFPIITNSETITVSNVLANQDFYFADYFSINPNPAKDILTIQTKENIEVSSINIYNTLGQLVLLIPDVKDISTIDVSSLKTGNYFIKVLSDKGVSSTKFIKE